MEIYSALTNFWIGFTFSIPFNYVLLIIGIMALSIIWGKQKLGLVAVAGTFLAWAFEANRTGLMDLVNGSSIGMLAALSIVLAMSVLVVMVFMDESH